MKIIPSRLDWAHITRDKYKIASIILFSLIAQYGIYNGHLLYQKQTNEIIKITSSLEKSHAQALDWLKSGVGGPEERPWVNVQEPFWAIWHSFHHVYKTPAPLMVLNTGQAHQFAYYKRVSMWSTPFDNDMTEEISNPEHHVCGNLDFTYVWLFLLPLLMIILTYNIKGLENDYGFMPLIEAHHLNESKWIVGRLWPVIFVLTIQLVLFLTIAVLIQPEIRTIASKWFSFGLFSYLYLLFWMVIVFLVIKTGKGSSNIALKMIGLWILLCIIIPGTLHQTTHLKHPTGYLTDYLEAKRESMEEIFQKDKEDVVRQVMEMHPDLHTTHAASDSFPYSEAVQSAYRVLANNLMKEAGESIEQDQLRRDTFIRSWYWINPVMFFQNKLNHIAGTDFGNDLEFRRQIQSVKDRITEILLVDEWNKVKVDTTQYKKYLALSQIRETTEN